MATDTYTLEYVAKIERLQAELAKIPGATDKAALAAAQRLEARMDKASRHAGKAVDNNIGGALKRIAAGSGYGDIAEKLSNLGQGVSALGAGSVVAAAGIGAIAAAGVGLYAATAATGVLADENARLRREVDDLVYSVGTLMPGAFESGTSALADLVAAMGPAVTGMRALINIGGELTDEFTTQGAITIGLLTSALSGNAEEAQRWAGIYNSSRGYVGAIEAGTAATVEAEKALRILRYNQTQWSGPKLKAEGGAGGAAKKAPRVVAAREHTTALGEEIAALQKRDEWAEKALELDQMEAAALAELTVQMGTNAEAIEEAGVLRASEAMARAEIIDGLRHERDLRIENREIARDAALSEIGQAARVAGAIGKMIEDRAGRNKKAALVGFRIQQGAAAAEVALSTIAAVIEAAPNPIAMALAGAAGGLATAAVFATPPPKFHQGGQADEGVAIVRQGERVLSERGARDYDQGLGDMNRGAAGMARGGGSGPRVSFEGRDLDVMLARVVRQHGATRRELDSRRTSGAY